MLKLRYLLLSFVIFGFIALSAYGSDGSDEEGLEMSMEGFETINADSPDDLDTLLTADSPLVFDSPDLAFEVLQQIDVYEPIDDTIFKKGNKYHKPKYGLVKDDDYCVKHRKYFTENPDFIFTKQNFFTNYDHDTLVRGLSIPKAGNDLQPQIGDFMPSRYRNRTDKYEFNLDINMFFLLGGIHSYKRLGKNFGCISQIYNQVINRTTLNAKDKVASSMVEYGKQYETRPQCFSYDKFFPKTWVMEDAAQCRDFFEKFNSEDYLQEKAKHTIVYIRKVGSGSHQAVGVQPVDEEEEKALRTTYQNGSLCGQVSNKYIVQKYIHNALLLNGHKFDFRVYMVMGSSNPTILYYHDGFLRVSLHPYDVNSKDKSVLLTNTALSTKIFDIAREQGHYQGLNETQLRNFQMWNLQRLQNYLLDKGLITDENWLDNYLRPEFKKAMIHLIRGVSGGFVKRSQLYELYGADFMLDEDLNLWFIECNSGPVLTGTSEEKERFMLKMLADQYEIAFGLLKSRMKRVINYVNEITRQGEVERTSSGAVFIKDLAAKQQRFKEITMNHFEPEFEPSPENGFSKIIDESYSGVDRYMGLISEECL